MHSFEVWDIVRVPFPYTDRPVREHRPALVIGSAGIQENHGLLWVIMITSAKNRGWPNDVPIVSLENTGLPVESVVRTAKIATIEAKEAAVIGQVPISIRQTIKQHLMGILG